MITAGCLIVSEEDDKTCLAELDRRDCVNMDRKVTLSG